MRPWYKVKLRSRTWAKLSTSALASSTRGLPTSLRGIIPPSGVAADAGGFGAGVSGASSTSVPLGCSPGMRATSQVVGEPFGPSVLRVMVKDSRTLIPADSICPATARSRNMTRPSVSEYIMRSPCWFEMVLPWPYCRATETGMFAGKSTTSRGVRVFCAVAIFGFLRPASAGFGPGGLIRERGLCYAPRYRGPGLALGGDRRHDRVQGHADGAAGCFMRSDHIHHFPHRPGLHHQLVPHQTRGEGLRVGRVDVGFGEVL